MEWGPNNVNISKEKLISNTSSLLSSSTKGLKDKAIVFPSWLLTSIYVY
ncbi:hypothetical protein Lalb_Chr22g0353851 [Lupinus albus]|uniref:Uncharacterized protein n=1 Tax=Lupinus albus TaxID=3870 RepID=A0A6A4NBZ7_LUPAL|nr:hypothetical protein Lalb_Chr22g0353851 [Lupinus albus]